MVFLFRTIFIERNHTLGIECNLTVGLLWWSWENVSMWRAWRQAFSAHRIYVASYYCQVILGNRNHVVCFSHSLVIEIHAWVYFMHIRSENPSGNKAKQFWYASIFPLMMDIHPRPVVPPTEKPLAIQHCQTTRAQVLYVHERKRT